MVIRRYENSIDAKRFSQTRFVAPPIRLDIYDTLISVDEMLVYRDYENRTNDAWKVVMALRFSVLPCRLGCVTSFAKTAVICGMHRAGTTPFMRDP